MAMIEMGQYALASLMLPENGITLGHGFRLSEESRAELYFGGRASWPTSSLSVFGTLCSPGLEMPPVIKPVASPVERLGRRRRRAIHG